MSNENNLKDLQVTSQIESDMWMINLTYKINKTLRIVTHMFLFAENEPFLTTPSAVEVRETIDISNLRAAPGNDGIPSLFCKPCWDTIGSALTEVMQEIHLCRPLQPSLST